jgi:hypothetical protein
MHWTQTPAGRKRQAKAMRESWARRKNGSAPPPPKEQPKKEEADELFVLAQVVTLYDKLPPRAKDYFRQRIS